MYGPPGPKNTCSLNNEIVRFRVAIYAENQTDSDGDGVFDSIDNCPNVPNPDQKDTDGNGVGDACNDAEDPDGDEYASNLDNCPTVFNPDQADTDGDGRGDACEAQVDIVSITPVNSATLRSQINLTSPLGLPLAGTVSVHMAGPPSAITFSILNTTCTPGDQFEFFLNGVSLGAIPADPGNTCTCKAPTETFTVSNAGLLASAWNTGGQNTLRFVKVGSGNAFAWVRADLAFAGGSPVDVCIADTGGGNCSVSDLCSAGFTFDPVDVTQTFDDPVSVTVVSQSYSNSTLPASLNLSAAPAGSMVLRATTAADPSSIDELRFTYLRTSCGTDDGITFFLNGVEVGTVAPGTTCTCNPQIETFVVTNPGLLSAWDPAGNNTVRVVRNDAYTAWIRVEVTSQVGTLRSCVFDANGGNCSEPDLCVGEYTYGPLDVSGGVGDIPQSDSMPFNHANETLLIINNAPPVCTGATANPSTIWPPNHQFMPITVTGVTDPDGDPVTITATSVRQDEKVTDAGAGSGNTSPDARLNPLAVRAERNGNPKSPGNGRVYHISYTADDGKGGQCTGTVKVCVPHDQGKGNTCVDGGPLYNSLAP